MRIAHNCQACGLDLSGFRAPPDPHYQLPVVVCPRCTLACARTRPESIKIWRAARLFHNRSVVLEFQLLLTLGFLMANFGAMNLLTQHPLGRYGLEILFGLAVAAGTGAWLGSAFTHWRRLPLLLAWGSLLSLIMLIGLIAENYEDLLALLPFVADSSTGTESAYRRDRLIHNATEIARHTSVLWVLVAGTAVALPLGRLIQGVNRVYLRAQFRRRKRHFRRLRDDR